MGLLDSYFYPTAQGNGQQEANIDPNTGLTEQQKLLLGTNFFGNLGAKLLAAGQKITPAQRAQYLSQLGEAQTSPKDIAALSEINSNQLLRRMQAAQVYKNIEMQNKTQQILDAYLKGNTQAPTNASSRINQIVGNPNMGGNPNAAPMPPPANGQPMSMGGGSPMPMNGGSPMPTGGVPQMSMGNNSLPTALAITEAPRDPIGAAKFLTEQNELTNITATDPQGAVRTIPVPKSQVPSIASQLQASGWTLGENKPTPFQTKIQEMDAKNMETWTTQRSEAAIGKSRIADMEEAAKNFTPGRGTSAMMEIGGYLNNAFGTDAFVKKEALGSFDAFAKNSLQLIGQQVKDQEGARAAASLWSMLQKGQPTAETSPEGMQRMFRFMKAIFDYHTTKANAADKWVSQYGSLRSNGKTFEQEFNSKVSFDKYLGSYLQPNEISGLSDSQRERYGVR